MSNLLKEAIVDAKALRDSALKNAENIVMTKYSQEVKKTLEQLLEQDEMGMELGGDLAAPGVEAPADETAMDMGMPPAEDLGAEAALPMDIEPGVEEGPVEEVTEDDIPLSATDDFNQLTGKNLNQFTDSGEEVELSIDLGALQEATSRTSR